MNLIATLACDGYKLSHRVQYPKNTSKVYSTWTPRSGKHANGIENVVAFGTQGALKELNELFNSQFFSKQKEEIINEYKRQVSAYLFNPNVETKHLEDLHDLGYLPLKVTALAEGTLVPFRVPVMTIENTKDEFFWLTNYLETILSSLLWKPATTASIAKAYRSVLDNYALETTGSTAGVEFQGHDFSMRGQSGPEDSARSGVGHLLSFVGTDTLPAINYAEQYYNADVTKELVGCSVPASEHSVMCAGGYEDERETYRRFIEELYPTGIVSIVSDTWDLFNVVTNILPSLKESILARDGGAGSLDKVVVRPDSGDPADILCGDPEAPLGSPENKGVIELLYETFGGTVSSQGYKILNPKIGAIYGDSITLERCKEICERLKQKGFASTNVVLGIGSYTYQFITRDTLGFAMKATSVTINGTEKAIFKAPKTDDGTKNSALGKVTVFKNNSGVLEYSDDTSSNISKENLLKTVFENGNFLIEESLNDIRKRLSAS
jgi:nicotinamide phosphoribosyltransferase